MSLSQNFVEIDVSVLAVTPSPLWNAQDAPYSQLYVNMTSSQNRKYITYRNAAREGLGHGQRQHAQNLVTFDRVWFLKFKFPSLHFTLFNQKVQINHTRVQYINTTV